MKLEETQKSAIIVNAAKQKNKKEKKTTRSNAVDGQ